MLTLVKHFCSLCLSAWQVPVVQHAAAAAAATCRLCWSDKLKPLLTLLLAGWQCDLLRPLDRQQLVCGRAGAGALQHSSPDAPANTVACAGAPQELISQIACCALPA